MQTFLQYFVLVVCAGVVVGIMVNPLNYDGVQRISLVVAAVAIAVFASRTIDHSLAPAAETPASVSRHPDQDLSPEPTPAGSNSGVAQGRGPDVAPQGSTSPRKSTARGLPASDTEPPRLAGFVIVTRELDAREGPVKLEFLAHLIDDMAGVAGSGYSSSPTQARFKSPSGRQLVDAIFSDSQRTEGTPQNGRYHSVATLPRYAEGGEWHLEHFLLVDQTGNLVYLKESEVASLGFPTTFRLAE